MFRFEYRPSSHQIYFGTSMTESSSSSSGSSLLGLLGVVMATSTMGYLLYQHVQNPDLSSSSSSSNDKSQSRDIQVQSRSLPLLFDDTTKQDTTTTTVKEKSSLLSKSDNNDDKTEKSVSFRDESKKNASVPRPKPSEDDEEEASGRKPRHFKNKLRESLEKSPTDLDMQSLFDEIDEDGDGLLSQTEVEHAICQRKQRFDLKPAIVLRAFAKADVNGDGCIGRDEFFLFLKMITYFQNLYQVFALMDTNHDRHLSKEEFQEAASILHLQNPDQVFAEMDRHFLGYIVFDDFCLWMAEQQANKTTDKASTV